MQESIQSNFQSFSLLVVGVARNCSQSIQGDVLRISQALKPAKSVSWLVVESDSADATVDKLHKLTKSVDSFQFVSLGTLREKIPKRTVRIACCRNKYVDEIRKNPQYTNIDYVIVVDFDGINTDITQLGIESCWVRKDWDVCTANQNAPYYDIYALRHRDWCPGDSLKQYEFLNKFSTKTEKNMYLAMFSKQIRIPIDHDWIEVDSAFGGFAVYKKKLFNLSSYRGLTNDDEVCEHVYFHGLLRKNNAKIFINPALINAKYTEHTYSLQRKLWVKLPLRRIIIFVLGHERFHSIKAWICNYKTS